MTTPAGGVPEQGLPIRILGDPILRRYAEPWTGDPGALTSRLERTMRAANGIGLAAPQIGESVRVAVIAVSDRFVLQMVNPLIVWRSAETATELEGCLSIPGYEVPVTRPVKITVDGGSNVVTLEGIQARAAQHEIDHLDGILILDRWLEQRAALERPRPALPAPEWRWCRCQGTDPIAHVHYAESPERCARCMCKGFVGWPRAGYDTLPPVGAALPPQTGNPAPSVYELSDDDVAVFLSVHRAEIENDGSAESAVREGWKVVTANRVNRGVSLLRAPQSGPPFAGEFPEMSAEELLLRRLLWLRHHDTTIGLYGDDGEMQCGKCMLDFRRMSARDIEARFFEQGLANAARIVAAERAGSGAETPPQPEIPK